MTTKKTPQKEEILIRDKTALLILADKGTCNIRKAKPNERTRWLMKKFIIEAQEWLDAKDKETQEEQMLDIVQLSLDLQEIYKLDSDSLKLKLFNKQKIKGGYTDFWILTLPTN